MSAWDQEYDVVVVGSGAGGMTAALCAAQAGLSVVVLEKTDRYGGTSAVSGGGIWIPCNDQMSAAGVPDSRAEALTYLKHLTRGEVPQARLEAYVDAAPEMVRSMARDFGVRFESVAKYPDYFPDQPGGKPGARTMQPAAFDARRLGDEFWRQREPYKGTLVLGRIAMDQVEAHTLFGRAPGWVMLTIRMLLRYWLDFSWRRRTWRDRRLVLGQGLVGQLRFALLQKKVPVQYDTALESLVEESGRVRGVAVQQGGRSVRIGARRGVVLATGGFESNQQMREQFLPKPSQAAWTAAPGINTGDGIRAGQKLGAGLRFMNLVWGAPTALIPGSTVATALFVERSLPGCVMVNARGQRFVNEAAPYTEAVAAIYADQASTGGTIPCWMVFDARFRKNYPAGPMLPGSFVPDAKLPREWLGKVYYRAATLEALAAQIGVDARGLAATVQKMNGYAAAGKDAEFGKGNNAFDRYYADPKIGPNPCLAPIVEAPFYAMPLYPGEIGTKGGLDVDERARVLRENGSVIEGLYAIGNCSAAVMGRTYAGPGATLGPAMTFGFVAARELASAGAQARKAAA
ncbi:MAG TPA: FAD-dependent oxidoreductase [Candidatus Binatia bacterium]|nr:FAD-dependent oxidoreductase [Candidatus Binatia bacterium]